MYNYLVGIMHGEYEGICNFDISELLNVFIYKLKYFALNTINNRTQYFNYGIFEIKSNPPLNFRKSIKKFNIQMSASEIIAFH